MGVVAEGGRELCFLRSLYDHERFMYSKRRGSGVRGDGEERRRVGQKVADEANTGS